MTRDVRGGGAGGFARQACTLHGFREPTQHGPERGFHKSRLSFWPLPDM